MQKLADVSHLQHWSSRNESAGQQLADAFEAQGILTDLDASRGIARWAYERAKAAGSVVWVRRGDTRVMSPGVELSI